MISVQLVRALQHEVRRRFKAGQEMRNDNADLSSQSRFCTVLDKASARNSRPQPRSGARVLYLADRSMTRATGRVSKNWRVERGHPLLDLAISSPATRPQVAGIIAVATRPEQVEQNVAAARWLLNPGELAEVDPMTADT
jgi:aryl-alcohol dehydrogenase-like predicted oxidoreductase